MSESSTTRELMHELDGYAELVDTASREYRENTGDGTEVERAIAASHQIARIAEELAERRTGRHDS